jgi:hypothetical protein
MRLQSVGVARTIVVRVECEGDDGSSRGKEGAYLITQGVRWKEYELSCSDVVLRTFSVFVLCFGNTRKGMLQRFEMKHNEVSQHLGKI